MTCARFEPIYTTKQQVLDAVCERLNDGRGRAFNEVRQACEYRQPITGTPCAIGALVPADHPLDAAMWAVEGGITSLLARVPRFRELFTDDAWEEHLLDLLQWRIHDNEENWNGSKFVGWPELAGIARRYHLHFDPEKYHA